jgi:hypothetical protein
VQALKRIVGKAELQAAELAKAGTVVWHSAPPRKKGVRSGNAPKWRKGLSLRDNNLWRGGIPTRYGVREAPLRRGRICRGPRWLGVVQRRARRFLGTDKAAMTVSESCGDPADCGRSCPSRFSNRLCQERWPVSIGAPGPRVLSAVAAGAPHVGVWDRTDRSGVRGQPKRPQSTERSRPAMRPGWTHLVEGASDQPHSSEMLMHVMRRTAL